MTERTRQPTRAASASASPSFLDDPTLAHAPFAVFVWDEDLDGFVWANGAGLNRWGALSLASLRASRLDRAMPAMTKLRDLSRMALPVEGLVQTLTFWTPRGACRMVCRCRPVDLSDGGHGLVLEAVDQHEASDTYEGRGADGYGMETACPSSRDAQLGNASRRAQRNGRPAHLPSNAHTNHDSTRRVGAPRPGDISTQVPGYLSGVERTDASHTTTLNGTQSSDLPSPSDDDYFAMQEIARMLARDTSRLPAQPATRVSVPQDLSAQRAMPPTTEAQRSPHEGINGHAAEQHLVSESGASLRDPSRTTATLDSGNAIDTHSDELSHPDDTSAPDDAPGHRFDTLNHELRTPLSSIIGFAEMMHREQLGPIGNERYREYAGDILDSARHALSLINDLLDASRVRAGHLDAAAEDVDVPKLLDRVIALMAPQAQAASVAVVRGYPPTLPTLRADPRALRQILLNILTNAFKFTPSDGHVFISAQHDDTHVVLDIRDTGIGMTVEQIANALKPWVRSNGEAALPSAPVGSGLGLPLVKALTEAQKGTLSVTSAPGEGTCVTVRLPRS